MCNYADADQLRAGLLVIFSGRCERVKEVKSQGGAVYVRFDGAAGYERLGFAEPLQVIGMVTA